MTIDFVITWVDMNDPEWQKEYNLYSSNANIEKNGKTEARFRDYGFLRYWFRGVEKFAPWVRKIHFITSGQKPDWLNLSNPKLNIVSHRDIIPAEFLPTYNSVVIERYMYRIKDLSKHFVYFNDDFFIIRKIEPDRFFKNGYPCDIAVFQYNLAWSQWYKRVSNNLKIINKHFDKKSVIERDKLKWFNKTYGKRVRMNYLLKNYGKFITLRVPHNAQPYLIDTFKEVWEKEGDILTATSSNRFRSVTDLTPELFRIWQICKGNFEPYNTYKDTKMFPLLLGSKRAIKAIYNQSYSLICLNDNKHIRNYDEVMEKIQAAFQYILPYKSSFEI